MTIPPTSCGARCAALVAALTLATTQTSAQLDGFDWTTEGDCTLLGSTVLHLQTGGGCSGESRASATVLSNGDLAFEAIWFSQAACCTTFEVRVAGKVLQQIGDGQSSWCGLEPACVDGGPFSVPVQAGDLIEIELVSSANELSYVDLSNVQFESAANPVVTDVGVGVSFLANSNVNVTGWGFDESTEFTVDGITVPATIPFSTLATLQIPTFDPGYHDLLVTNPTGATLVPDGVAMLPALSGVSNGPGGLLELNLRMPSAGIWILFLGTNTLGAPFPVAPDILYGLLLDPAGGIFSMGSGAQITDAPVNLVFPLDSDPSISGAVIPFQGWVSSGFPPSATFTFTNLAEVQIP